jgi:membrane protein YqaA with SNARE-associated domain
VRRYSHYLAIFVSLCLMAAILIFRSQIVHLGNYGYLGVFLISIATTLTIIIPVPGWAIVAGMGSVLNPALVGLVSGVGGTIGEMNGYLLGFGGRMGLQKARYYDRVVGWMNRWGGLALFVLALTPNPLFDVAAVLTGSLRYPLWKYLVYGGSGRLIKYVGYAYAGHFGLRFLF